MAAGCLQIAVLEPSAHVWCRNERENFCFLLCIIVELKGMQQNFYTQTKENKVKQFSSFRSQLILGTHFCDAL